MTIRGNPEFLTRLRAWVEPLIGPVSDRSLTALQNILEDGADQAGIVPQYRKTDG